MRILHVITDLEVGGAEMMLFRLAEQWHAENHAQLVVSLMHGGMLKARLAQRGIAVVDLGMSRGRIAGTSLMRLKRIVMKFRPDVIQGWMYHANIAATLGQVLSLRRIPVSWSIHYTLQNNNEKLLTRFVIKAGALISKSAAAIIYCSKASAQQHAAIGYMQKTAHVFPNGIDIDRFRPDANATKRLRRELGIITSLPLVGNFARFDPMKDHQNLLEAAALLKANNCPIHLILAGSGIVATNAALSAMIARLGLDDNVSLLGERSDVERLMPGLQVFALASAYGEAFPLVLGEAMASGVPCVATDVGDSATIVGDAGIIVPPRDPKRLAAAISDLLRNPTLYSSSARERIVDRYSLTSMSESYLKLYRSIKDPPNVGPPSTGKADAVMPLAGESSICVD